MKTRLKAIQVIEDALNCTFPLYGVTDAELRALFGKGRDIAFIDEVNRRLGQRAVTILSRVSAMGTWPTRRECEVFPSAIPEPMRQLFARERKRQGLPERIDLVPSPLDELPNELRRRPQRRRKPRKTVVSRKK